MLARLGEHLSTLGETVKFPTEAFRGKEAKAAAQRVLVSMFAVAVVVPVVAGVSGWLIGASSGLNNANRAGLNPTDTVKSVRDEGANQYLQRVSIGSRVMSIAFIMPEVLALLALKLLKSEDLAKMFTKLSVGAA